MDNGLGAAKIDALAPLLLWLQGACDILLRREEAIE
jgi:hypothetical protein